MKDIKKVLDELDQTLAQISAPRKTHAQIQAVIRQTKAKYEPKKED